MFNRNRGGRSLLPDRGKMLPIGKLKNGDLRQKHSQSAEKENLNY